jgi:hypothetical protein
MKEPGDPLSIPAVIDLSIQAVIDQAREELPQGSKSRSMSGEKMNVKDHNEEWAQLCQQAAVEKDPERLMRLVGRIVELLDARRALTNHNSNSVSPITTSSDSRNA